MCRFECGLVPVLKGSGIMQVPGASLGRAMDQFSTKGLGGPFASIGGSRFDRFEASLLHITAIDLGNTNVTGLTQDGRLSDSSHLLI